MKKLAIVLAILAPLGVILALTLPGGLGQRAGAYYSRGAITVSGDATLLSVAQQIGDKRVFSYDPVERRAVCNANLTVRGTLRIGGPKREDREVLEFATQVCGDRDLQVAPGGKLILDHAELATVDRFVKGGVCQKGYALHVKGSWVCRDSEVLYVSGASSDFLMGRSTADIRDSLFSGGDSYSFSFRQVDGKGIRLVDSTFECKGRYGVIVLGRQERGEPLVLDRCVFSDDIQIADVHVLGRHAEVILLDCDFNRDRITFAPAQQGGEVHVKWRLLVQVQDEGTPVAGKEVRAESVEACGRREVVTATTDERGQCWLTLTEFVATAGAPRFRQGTNDSTPHRILLDGQWAGMWNAVRPPAWDPATKRYEPVIFDTGGVSFEKAE